MLLGASSVASWPSWIQAIRPLDRIWARDLVEGVGDDPVAALDAGLVARLDDDLTGRL